MKHKTLIYLAAKRIVFLQEGTSIIITKGEGLCTYQR